MKEPRNSPQPSPAEPPSLAEVDREVTQPLYSYKAQNLPSTHGLGDNYVAGERTYHLASKLLKPVNSSAENEVGSDTEETRVCTDDDVAKALEEGKVGYRPVDFEKVLEACANGTVTLSQLSESTEEELEQIYRVGYTLFSSKRFEQSELIFQGLVHVCPYNNAYWRALGAVKHVKKEYAQAIEAYTYALAVHSDDVVSCVYRGECYMTMGLLERARRDFRRAMETGRRYPDLSAWADRAALLLNTYFEEGNQ